MPSCASHPERDARSACSRCARPLCAECERTLDGRPYCAACVAELERALARRQGESDAGPEAAPAPPVPVALEPAGPPAGLLRPLAFALAAGAVGAGAWYLSVVASDYKLGILAVGIGWLVGFAALRGARGRGGPRLALASVLIALAAMLAGEYLIVNHYVLAAVAEENPGAALPAFIGAGPFFEVYGQSLGVMDAVFYAIGAYEAWKVPAAARGAR